MSKCKKWEDFIEQMYVAAFAEYRDSRVYELSEMRQKQLEQMLANELTSERQKYICDILSEMFLLQSHEVMFFYKKGITDGAFISKSLGTL